MYLMNQSSLSYIYSSIVRPVVQSFALLFLNNIVFRRLYCDLIPQRTIFSSSPAYGVFISQRIRYARACSSYECFILRARRLSSMLLKQGYLVERLKSSFRKFYGRYGDLIQQYEVTLSRMLNDILTNSDFPTNQTFHQFHELYTELDLHRIMSGFHEAFATGVASKQGTLTLPDTWFPPLFGTCLSSNFWDQIPWTCHVFTDFSPWIPLSTFSILLCLPRGLVVQPCSVLTKWISKRDCIQASFVACVSGA